MGIFDAKDLANYIYKYYDNRYSRPISPIKMQKSLYFLFAYWGGYVRKANDNMKNVECDVATLPEEILFDNKIEAWTYGPVIPDIYTIMNSIDGRNGVENVEQSEIRDFIDDVLDDIFVISDFKLVDISHMDEAWKRHYKKEALHHNEEIPKEEIIKEYATR